MSFLDLPPEMRFQVYAYIAIPDSAPFSDYHGMYLSCKQIRTEMNKECGRVLGSHLKAIQTSLIKMSITIPTTFLAMQHIHLTYDFPRPREPSNTYPFFEPLSRLLDLRLASLTVTTAKGSRQWFTRMVWPIEWVFSRFYREEIHARRIVVEIPDAARPRVRDWFQTAERMFRPGVLRETGEVHHFRWALLPGRRVNAVWETPELYRWRASKGRRRSARSG
jgi:hypothetical protein